jgi:glycerol-3-phosphate dehydrogenase
VRHLSSRYGDLAADIVRLIAERPDLGAPVAPGALTNGAEVVYGIRHEMACRLSDIVIRRTGLGAAGHPGAAAVTACARVAAAELGWDAATVADEISEVNRFYEISEP